MQTVSRGATLPGAWQLQRHGQTTRHSVLGQKMAVRRHKSPQSIKNSRYWPLKIPLLWAAPLAALRRASFVALFKVKGRRSISLTEDGRRRNWFEIAGSFRLSSVVLIYVLSSIVVYGQLEGWNAEDSVYFAVSALTTVGYGDLVPSHPFSCIFFSFAILVALVLLATRLSSYLSYLVEKEANEAKTRLIQQLRSPFSLSDDEEIMDEEGQRRKIRQRFRAQLQLLTTYLLLASCISKHALGLASSWQALYFSVVTLTTVGFGDLVPVTASGKWVVSILCLFGVPIFGNTMAELVALIYGERTRHVKQQLPSLSVPKLLQMRKFAQELDDMGQTPISGEEHRISKFEFCCFLLVQNKIIDMEDVKAISKNFGHLDVSMDGSLWSKDALAWELQKILQANGNGKHKDETEMPPHNAEKLRQSLDSMDLKTAGCIELAELQSALKKNGVRTSEAAVKSFFAKLDLNHDGKISFPEFRALVGRVGTSARPGSARPHDGTVKRT